MNGPTDDSKVLAEWIDLERSMVVVRLAAAVFGLVMVLTYDAEPYPPGIRQAALGVVFLLAAANVPIAMLLRRVGSVARARRLGLATLLFDACLVLGFFFLYSFDDSSAHFLLFFLLPAVAALKFRLAGALIMWAVCTAAYVGRGILVAEIYGFALNLPSVAFRMGILFLVSLVLGVFARRLATQAEVLRGALARLEAEERWRTALIDMLAHDLRAPIGTASSTMELIARRIDTMDPPQVRDLATSAIRQNRRALYLADDLLEMARARQDRLVVQRETVHLRTAIHSAIDQFDSSDEWATVEVDDTAEAYVDPARFDQILINLLSNARKHGRPPARISAEVGDGDLTLRISDSGDGLSEAHARSLFAPLNVNPRSGSVGLGMWIVLTLTTAHGGRAYYETDDGRPTFVVWLPFAAAETAERSPARS